MDVKIGQTIESKDGKKGIVQYIGPLHLAAGTWIGLQLPDATGKNDGSVQGERYFECKPGYGIFLRKESVVRIVKQAPTSTTTPQTSRVNGANGSVVKARPSAVGAGIGADAARKRQSLMSTGSSTAGSRLSLRVGLLDWVVSYVGS
jgi:dynactin 1